MKNKPTKLSWLPSFLTRRTNPLKNKQPSKFPWSPSQHEISWYPIPNNWHIKIRCLDCDCPFVRHIHHPKPLLWVKTMAEFWTPSLLTLSSRWSVLILKSTPVGLHYWRLFDGEVVQRKLWGKLGGQNSFKFTYSGDVGVGKVVLRVSKQQWRLAHPRVSDQQHLYCLKFKH